jgi:hypothetical protein
MTTRVNPAEHEIVVKASFMTGWNKWYDEHAQREKPAGAAIADLLRKCIQYLPSELPWQVDTNRLAFRHPHFPNQVFIAVLEGVSEVTPFGRLVFIGWREYESKKEVRGRITLNQTPTYAPAPFDATEATRLNYTRHHLRECEEWLAKCPPGTAQRPAVVEVRDRYKKDLDDLLAADTVGSDVLLDLSQRVRAMEMRLDGVEKLVRKLDEAIRALIAE